MSGTTARKLRIGLFVDSIDQPWWMRHAVDLVLRSELAEVVLLFEVAPDGGKSTGTRLQSLTTRGRHLLFRLYAALDRRLWGAGPDPLKPASIAPAAGDVATRGAIRRRGDDAVIPGAADLAAIREQQLDVALWLTSSRPGAELLPLARYGFWSFFFGESGFSDSNIAGFWEAMLARPETVSGLKMLSESAAADAVIYMSSARTFPYSFRRNQENVLRKTAEFAYRKIRDLHHAGPGAIAPVRNEWAKSREERMPAGNFRMTALLSLLLGRIARRAIQKLLFVDQWVIAYKFDADTDETQSLSGFTWLMPPKDRFWADPFPVEKDGRYFIFFEELMFDSGKGHISVIEVDAAGRQTQPVKVLEEKHHLSYPFIFEWDGVYYMIPESGEKRCVKLYRCARFPDQWLPDRMLIENIRAVDATLHQIGDKWWMFVNVSPEGVEIYDELHLYYANSPFGPWLPHYRNPVVSNVMYARPAGYLFERDDQLFRPAQICAPIYGAGLSFNRILRITPEEYVERETRKIFAGTEIKAHGIHTWNKAGSLRVIDCFVRTPRLPWPAAF